MEARFHLFGGTIVEMAFKKRIATRYLTNGSLIMNPQFVIVTLEEWLTRGATEFRVALFISDDEEDRSHLMPKHTSWFGSDDRALAQEQYDHYVEDYSTRTWRYQDFQPTVTEHTTGYLRCLDDLVKYHQDQQNECEAGEMMSMAESAQGAAFHKRERERLQAMIATIKS